jgi:hypothetical protein
VRLRAGQGNQLLFNQTDFADPDASPALRALAESGKGGLRALGETLREIWAAGVAWIPKLDPGVLPTPAHLPA